MRTAEDRLANTEVGAAPKQVQRDVVADLDKLIQATQQPPQGGQNQQQNPSAGGGQGRQGQQQQQQQQMSRAGRRGSRGGQPQPQQQAGRQGQGAQPGQPGAGNKPGAGNSSGHDDMNKIADLWKDVWGHLPETMRAEMDAYARPQFMAKYEDVIKQYYSTIAEKGRRKAD
jgi:hypothetical protein